MADKLPTGQEIMATHEAIEEDYDLKYKGVRVAAPRIKFKRIVQDARDDYNNAYDRAAFLLRKIITAHYFEDANKRTALATVIDYLGRHGLQPAKIEEKEAEPVLKAIRKFSVKELSEWLETGEIDESKFNP